MSNYDTDKGTSHSYLQEYYPAIFEPLVGKKAKILEVGILRGGSLKLWRDWLKNAEIYGVDKTVQDTASYIDGAVILLADGYDEKTASLLPDEFDVIIDDGLHTMDAHKKFINIYHKKVKQGGKLIIEDIQDFSNVEEIESWCPDGWSVRTVDLRKVKGRFDDVIVEFTNDRYWYNNKE